MKKKNENKKRLLILKGLGTIGSRHYYILKKEELFREYFNKILEKIGIKESIYEEQGKIKQRKNEIDHFKNNEIDIDVVYTQNRVIIIVRGDNKKLKKFKSLIKEYCKIEP